MLAGVLVSCGTAAAVQPSWEECEEEAAAGRMVAEVRLARESFLLGAAAGSAEEGNAGAPAEAVATALAAVGTMPLGAADESGALADAAGVAFGLGLERLGLGGAAVAAPRTVVPPVWEPQALATVALSSTADSC